MDTARFGQPDRQSLSESASLLITSPDGYDHLVDDAVLATSFDGHFLAHCGAVVVSASMTDCPGRPCPWCLPPRGSRPARRRDPLKLRLALRVLCEAAFRLKVRVGGGAERHRWVPVGEGVFVTISTAAALGSGGAGRRAVLRSASASAGREISSSAMPSAGSQGARNVDVS